CRRSSVWCSSIVSVLRSGLIVGRTAHVLVRGRQGEFGLLLERYAIEAVLEDGLHGAVAVRTTAQRAEAGGFEPLRRVALRQPHEAQTRTIPLLRMRTALQDPLHQRTGGCADSLCPADQAGGTPLEVLAVRLGPMLRNRGVAADSVTTRVRGDAPARVKDLDSAAGEADLDRLTGECVGHAVVVAGELDMVVDVHARLAPLGEAVGSGGQRQQRRALQRLEER